MSIDLLKDPQTKRLMGHNPNKPAEDFDVFYRHTAAQTEEMLVIDQTPSLNSNWPMRFSVLDGTCQIKITSGNGNCFKHLESGESGIIRPHQEARFMSYGSVPCRVEIVTLTPED